jgi:hypothetical protein
MWIRAVLAPDTEKGARDENPFVPQVVAAVPVLVALAW